MLFAWFMLAGLILFFAPENWTNKFQLAFAYVFRRPLSIGRDFSLSPLTQLPSSDVVSRNRYSKLQNHLANMMEWLNQERQKVEKLSGLRDRSVWEGVNLVLADVITASVGGSHSRLIINRGVNDGLAKGQFVVGDFSIIGTISDVDSRTAQVKSITDPTSKIAVNIAKDFPSPTHRKRRSRSNVQETPMIMQGNGNNSAKVKLLPTKHKIEMGNVVYAQKKPGFLDAPMIVGKVARCRRDGENPLLWDITVKPACDIEKLNEVTIIIMNPQE
jgi:cell shape-determining protein MreC